MDLQAVANLLLKKFDHLVLKFSIVLQVSTVSNRHWPYIGNRSNKSFSHLEVKSIISVELFATLKFSSPDYPMDNIRRN